MTRAHRFLSFVLLSGLSASLPGVVSAQSPPTTGTPPFGSFGGGPDVINLANNNVHLDIPVMNKPGRGGFNFTYDLSYDSSVWAGGVSSGTSLWYPVGNWGWRGITEASTGYLSYTSAQHFACQIWNPDEHKYDRYTYVLYNFTSYGDPYGVPHPLNVTLEGSSTPCSNDPNLPSYATGTISDGSGYAYTLQAPPLQGFEYVYPATGGAIQPPLGITGAANNTDRNGNQITVNGSGQFFDTLSSTTPVLTVAGSGPLTFTYTAPSGANSSYTMKYTAYTVRTNFGCSNIAEYGPTSNNLVSEIDLPDGSKYTFQYEATPGYSGDVTGRLYQVTLPTGSTITYTYSGGNNGINCSDGSTATLTRATPDTAGGNPWTYAHSESGTAWTTLITDPQGNQTNMNFQGIYETQRQVYQGTTSGTLLRQRTTCYNGNTSNCNSTAITLPVTEQIVTDQYGGSSECQHIYKYNSVGGLTEQDDYDYGSGVPGALLRQTLITYASLSNNITAFQQQVTVKNGAGTVVSQTNYNYDETTPASTSAWGITQHASVSGSRGNLTSINYPVSGLTPHFTYYDTGVPNTSQDINGATTTYSYNSVNNAFCNGAFPTSISEPLSMSRSMTWNCTGGVQLTSIDENNQTTTTAFSDQYFWRPASVSYPDGGLTSWTYNSPTSLKTTTKMNSSQNIVSTQLLDGLGRQKEQQLNSDPLGADYQDTTYDSLGRVSTVSNPYRYTSDYTYGLTTTQYDPLNRITVVILPDGSQSTVSYYADAYAGIMTTYTDPAGAQRRSWTNALGELTQLNEAAGTPPSLGTPNRTYYGYDTLGNLLTVTQEGNNAQQNQWRNRTFAYDAMSRLTSETNPETGTTTYHYDASPNQGDLTSRVAPAPNQTGSNTVTSTYTYDALHRLTQKSYSDGSTPNAQFYYDLATPWGTNYGGSYIGRLNEANTSTSSGLVASSIFVYDPVGRVTMNGKCTPTNCSLAGFHTHFSYDLAGDLTSYLTSENGITFSYQYDAAGRQTTLSSSLSDANHPATLATVDSSVGYYPFGALRKMNLGNSLTQTAAFNKDLQSCRANVNSSATALGTCADAIPSGNIQDFNYGFNLGSSDNGNVVSWTGTGQQSFSRTYTYDALNRLATLSSPSDPNGCTGLSWAYDAWGNRTAQTATGGSCLQQPSTTFSANNQLPSPYAYDAAGNMTYDGSHYYFYDAENRLIQVQSTSTLGACSAAIACYTYDALGLRVQKTVGSAVTQYVHDLGNRTILETNGNGNGAPTADYFYLAGSFVAEYANSTTYFAHPDHLGSTRLVTGLNQAVVQNLDYLPFGELNSSDSGISTHKFTGDEHDSETSLDHTQFRQYSSSLGRWMHPDPAGLAAVDPTDPQSWNRYAYVRNTPTIFLDPLGLTPACSTAQNRDPDSQQQESNAGGPFVMSDGDLGEPDPQHPTGGCGYLPGGGISMDGVDITDMPFFIGSGAAFALCPDNGPGGCEMNQNGEFITPVWVPSRLAFVCVGPKNDPNANCLNKTVMLPGEWQWGTAGNQFAAAITASVPVSSDPTNNGILQLEPLMEAQEQLEFSVAKRILLPVMMVYGGITVAAGGLVATGAVCATAVGCLASPITLTAFLGGLALADEGIYYAINGKFFPPER